MATQKEIVDIECRIVHETPKAYLIDDGKTRAWVAKSFSEWDKDAKTMTIPVWVAEEKGFI